MKKALAIALVVVFVLAFSVPAFAQSMSHTVKEEYVDAVIDIERQAGHLCNTGAELKYSVKGSASEFMAERAISQVKGKITVSQDNAGWIAGATPLTVTSVIELCAPAKYEYDASRWAYNPVQGWNSASLGSGVVPPPHGYDVFDWSSKYFLDGGPATLDYDGIPYGSLAAALRAGLGLTLDQWLQLTPAQRTALLEAAGLLGWGYTFVELTALTDQIWAVQVQSDPGFSGNLEQQWEAAYGDYEGWKSDGPLFPGNGTYWSPLFLEHEDVGTHKSAFGFRLDDDDYVVVKLGGDYVGNYFNMQQHARTSQGTLKRYIDISSPWSGAYVSENTTVTGKAEVHETFAMGNLGPGADIATDWWELF